MSAVSFLDRVKETTTSTGTGTLTLAGAATGYQAFSALGNGARCRFCTTDGTAWEIAEGVYTLSGTTLTRASIIASSNSNAAVSWAAGSKDVFLVADASFIAGLPTVTASTTAPTNPRTNDLWFKTDEGSLKIYYNDGDSTQWIDITAGQPLNTGGMVKIGKVVCVGGETTITFSNIPQTFSDLKLLIVGRDTTAGTGEQNINLQLNGDATAANYTGRQQLQVQTTSSAAGTGTASTTGNCIGILPGAGGTVGKIEATIANYAGASFSKMIDASSVGDNGTTRLIQLSGFTWSSTAAVNKLVCTAATAFAAGTTAVLYGLG